MGRGWKTIRFTSTMNISLTAYNETIPGMTNTPPLESFNFGKLLLLLLFIQEEKTWLKFNCCPRVDINFHNSLNLHPFASPVRELYYSCKEQGRRCGAAASVTVPDLGRNETVAKN